MPNSLNQSAINQIYLSNSTERFVVSNSGDYYWWNNFNRSYQPIDIASLPGQIIGVDSDNAGNLVFLTLINDDDPGFPPPSYLTTWNASSQSFGNSEQFFMDPWLSSPGNYPFAYISSTEFLLIFNGDLYQLTPPPGDDWAGNNIDGIKLGSNFATTVVGLDGSGWALDVQGQAWIVDGTQVSLFNGSNNPPLKQLSVVDSNRIYGLGTDGNVYQWSIAANSFIDISNFLSNPPPSLAQIQVDEQGILYGISSQNQGYQLFDTTSVVDISNPNTQPSGLTTITDNSGVTHAVWNENGQIYYGYQQAGGNGQYIGVAPLSSGIGTPTQGSSTDLNLINSSGTIQAYWINNDGNDTEVYSSNLSPSLYGGYQWSNPQNLTNDDLADSNLKVTILDNNRVLITTQKQGVTRHQIIDTNQSTSIPINNTNLPFRPKGQGFVYDLDTAPDNSSLLGGAQGLPLPKDFSISITKKKKDNDINSTTTSISATISGSVDQQYISQTGQNLFVPSNSIQIAAGIDWVNTLQPYIQNKLNFSLQSGAKWPGIQAYPGATSFITGVGYELDVETLGFILDKIAPGTGEIFEELNESGVLQLKLEALVALGISVSLLHSDTSSNGDDNYFFELVDSSLEGANANTPESELFWEFEPQKIVSYLEDVFRDPAASVSFSLSTGLALTTKVVDFIKIKIKSTQNEIITRTPSDFNIKTTFTYKWSMGVDLWLFSLDWGGSNSVVEYNKKIPVDGSEGDSLGFLPPSFGQTAAPAAPGATSIRRVNYEPKSTTHLLTSESPTDLVDSADITYVIQGNTAYGTFAAAVNDNSDNFTYLYFVQGTVTTVNNQTTIAWNPATLQAIPNTSGANQRPEIAIDNESNNVLITWQYESITNPTVAAIATTPPGQVYLVYGQAGNNPINLSSLGENPSSSGAGFYWTLDNEYFASLGQAVTALGDVNGGGKADFAFTAPDLNDEQGGVYVVFGEQYSQVNNLNNLGSNGLLLTGQALSELGYSIANAGDVNGDGKSDLIIGAPGLNNNQGAAYLLYGGALFQTPQTITDIDTLLQNNPTYGQQITNPNGQIGDRFGTSVTGGQDFNGDGKADYAISAPEANQASGEITLILSQLIFNELFTLSIDNNGNLVLVNQTTNTEVWNSNTAHLVPEPEYASYYEAVMEANGNFTLYEYAGQAQLSYWSTNTSGNPGAYLALGEDGGLYIRNQQGNNIYTLHQGTNPNTSRVIRLSEGNSLRSDDPNSTLTTSNYLGGTITLTNSTSTVNGEALLDIGSIALIPDVNQDGRADLLIGGTGAAVILFGSNLSTQNLDLATLTPGQGFVILDDTGLYLPLQVSSAGDVNGDGINDILVGHPAGQDAQGQPFSGSAYVVFGGSSLSTSEQNSLAFSDLNGSNGFKIVGAGTEVTGAGDINGDGVADLIVSEPDAQNQSGVSYVIYGGSSNQIGSIATINVSQVGTTVNGYIIGQANANQLSGSSVSPIGDINGDGKIDLLVGAPYTIPSADLTNLQNTIAPNYITGQLNGSQVSFNNPTPAPIPNLAPGEALESLTATPFGILGIVVNGNELLAGFWQARAGWKVFQTIATLTDDNGIFTDISVNAGNAGNPVTVSWGTSNTQSSTTVLNQSIYNGRGWNNTGFTTYANPAPTEDIDNIITQPGNTPQFSVLNQRVKESHGKVVFTVTRKGDTSQPVTLNYRTEDITATATSDYEHGEGTITFAPGETTKSIEILVYEDTLEEHLHEKFQLLLTPTSSSLAPLSATATLADTNPTINLLAIDSGFEMVGPANALLTYAISSAGDVDGDGYGEFLISAPGDNSSQGKIYLIAGAKGMEVSNQGLNVDSLSIAQGLSITGVANATTQAGYTLSNWGNNYYALSTPNLSLGASGTSSIYVFTKATLNQYFKKQTSVSITSLDSSPLTGNSADAFGKNVLLFDLDKDGTPELIVGAPLSNQVFIYTLSGNSKTLQATLTVSGNQSLGSALQVLDLDGDGNLDIVMGASTANPINDSAGNLAGYGGAIYILKGTGSLPQNTTLTNSTSSVNWVFNGASNLTGQGNNGSLNPSTGEASSNQQTSTPFYDRVGSALAVLDLNGDGHQDLAIGAPNAAVGSGYKATANLGKAYVLFGNQNPSLSNLSQIGVGQGVTFQGVLASGQAGWEVANGQDMNKDGIADLLIGAPFAYGNAGSAYVAFGSTNAYGNTSTVQLDPNVSNSRVFQYQGVANPLGGSNVFNPGSVGQSLGGVGDINGDRTLPTGGDDILLGAPSSDNALNQGQIYVAIGHPWLQGGLSLNVNDLRSDNGFIELNANPALGVGDVNGDGYADFINTNGQLTLGASTLSNVSQQRTFALAGTLQNNPAFFTSGDFNADGYQDIVAFGTLNGQIGFITYTGGGVTQNILGGQLYEPLLPPGSDLIQITTGDVDGDGDEDFLLLSIGQGGLVQIDIYRGSASGLSNNQPDVNQVIYDNSSAGNQNLQTAAVHVADLNGDGVDEIFIYMAFATFEAAGVWAYSKNLLNPVPTGFDSELIKPIDGLAADILRISSGDVNGDGYEDVLVSSRAEDNNTKTLVDSVYYGNPNLSQLGPTSRKQFSSTKDDITPPGYSNSAKLSTFVGDVNADGFDDILIDQFTSSLQSNIYLGSATGALSVNVPIQGLPNRQTLYQTGQAGDINGDGYDDFLMADQDYKLTYAIYGQDWEPQTATWNSNVTVQSLEGTNGNDVFQSNPSGNFLLSINGQNGDDYVNTPILPASQTQSFLFKGGQGDDQFGLPATDSSYITHIDGGSGYDTLFIQESAGSANSIDLTKLYQKIFNIEEIDLGYDNSVIFDLNSLLQILDSNKTLIINGVDSIAKPSDQNNSNWSQMGEDTYNGKIYQIYSYANTAVEVWVEKGGVTWSPSSISLEQSLSSYQGIFLLNGNQLNLLTNLVSTNTSNVNELGIFKVDNDQGYINGLAPDSPDYLKAALDSDRTQVLFSAITNRPNGLTVEQIQRVLDVSLDHKFGFYVIENSTTDTVQNQLKETGKTTVPIFLSTSPNLTVSEPVAGSYQLDWSDSAIGSEGANTLVVETQGSQEKLPQGSQLQGNAQSEVLDLRKLKGTVNIEASLYREAGYNNTVGFYAVDLEGKVVDPLTGLAVTDSPTKDNAEDYLQKALQYRANIALSVENQATVTQVTQLQGGLLYAPFLIQDGSFLLLGDDDLSNDPQVFFPYLGVNSDKVDHIRLLGNNLFGFEDLTGGGDLDYNDVIVKVNLLV
jgi:hypothetical protein